MPIPCNQTDKGQLHLDIEKTQANTQYRDSHFTALGEFCSIGSPGFLLLESDINFFPDEAQELQQRP